jgi:hypothetical protein
VKTKHQEINESYSAFAGNRLVARDNLESVLRDCKAALDGGLSETLLIFDDAAGKQIDFDFRGTLEDVLSRAIPTVPEAPKAGPGRPKLGVVSREVSLLPRHWEWLEGDPQGISAALRRLIDDARKRDQGEHARAQARDAASRFMWCMTGDFPHFEEASRALFAGDAQRFHSEIAAWPKDVVEHLTYLTKACF